MGIKKGKQMEEQKDTDLCNIHCLQLCLFKSFLKHITKRGTLQKGECISRRDSLEWEWCVLIRNLVKFQTCACSLLFECVLVKVFFKTAASLSVRPCKQSTTLCIKTRCLNLLYVQLICAVNKYNTTC